MRVEMCMVLAFVWLRCLGITGQPANQLSYILRLEVPGCRALHLGNFAGHSQTVNLEAFDPSAAAIVGASCNV